MPRGRSDRCRPVVLAFVNKQEHRAIEGTESKRITHATLFDCGIALFLYGNRVAWWEEGRIHIQINGFGPGSVQRRGWNVPEEYVRGDFGRSPVTRHRLSMIPGVDIYRHQNTLRLNGRKWDGLATPITKGKEVLT